MCSKCAQLHLTTVCLDGTEPLSCCTEPESTTRESTCGKYNPENAAKSSAHTIIFLLLFDHYSLHYII